MITLQEQIGEAQRELALRRQCYPQWIASGKLDAGDADHQLHCMEAIVRTLQRLDVEQRQLSLFATRA
jgi:predicted transcriptional regulator